MATKKTTKEIGEQLEKLGYKLIGEYKNSHTRTKIMCPKGHIWETTWGNFQSGYRCKKCSGNEKKTQQEIEEYAKSRGFVVLEEYKNNGHKLRMKCKKGHDVHITWNHFKQGHGCRECAGNNKKTQQEIEEYVFKFGYKLVSTYNGSKQKIKLLCPNGHEWNVFWPNFRYGKRCYHCFGNPKLKQGYVEDYLNNFGYKLISEYIKSQRKFKLVCPKGHIWETNWNDFKSKECRCPHCYHNKPEGELSSFLSHNNVTFDHINKKFIAPLHLDFYIPSLKLSIEYCGLYWHSEAHKDKNYHLKKLEMCREKGIRLLTVFEDEWLNKKDMVLSKLLGLLGKHQKIFARKCKLKEVDLHTAKEFINNSHLQGYSTSIKAWGLYCNNELVSCMTVGKHHRQNSKYRWVLNRFCNKLNTTIVGGASKLLKATKDFRPLVSFADLRWSEGNVYKKLGFILEKTLKPDYSYIRAWSRLSKQSLKLKPNERGLGKTEHQLRLEQGYLRIYDCGKQRWVLH